MGKFTNKTTDGAKRLFALLAVLILLFSGFAHVLATNFGRVKIEQINIDARGALLDGERTKTACQLLLSHTGPVAPTRA